MFPTLVGVVVGVGAFAYFVWEAMGKSGKSPFSSNVAKTQRRRADTRQDVMQNFTGEAWDESGEAELRAELSGSSLNSVNIGFGGHTCLYGPLKLEVEDTDIRIFDWEFRMQREKMRYYSLQTIGLVSPEGLDAPDFYLRPWDVDQTNKWLSVYDQVEVLSCDGYVLESPVAYRAEAMFFISDEAEALFHFISQRRWTVECTGQRVLAYRLGSVVQPDEFKHLANDMLHLVDLLREAAEAGSRRLDMQVESSLG